MKVTAHAVRGWMTMAEYIVNINEKEVGEFDFIAITTLKEIGIPVVRCRECKFLRFTGTVWKCNNRLVMMLCEPNDYCSRAERKEE